MHQDSFLLKEVGRHCGLKYAVELSIGLLGCPPGAFTRVISDPAMGSGLVKEYVARVMNSLPNTDFARAYYGCESQITVPESVIIKLFFHISS
jgi:hypothetical protein